MNKEYTYFDGKAIIEMKMEINHLLSIMII